MDDGETDTSEGDTFGETHTGEAPLDNTLGVNNTLANTLSDFHVSGTRARRVLRGSLAKHTARGSLTTHAARIQQLTMLYGMLRGAGCCHC